MTPSSPRPSSNFADIPINNCSPGPTNSDQNTYSQKTMTIVFTHKSNPHSSVFSLLLLPLQFLLLFLTHSLGKPSVIGFSHNIVKNHDNRLGFSIFLYKPTLIVAATGAKLQKTTIPLMLCPFFFFGFRI